MIVLYVYYANMWSKWTFCKIMAKQKKSHNDTWKDPFKCIP